MTLIPEESANSFTNKSTFPCPKSKLYHLKVEGMMCSGLFVVDLLLPRFDTLWGFSIGSTFLFFSQKANTKDIHRGQYWNCTGSQIQCCGRKMCQSAEGKDLKRRLLKVLIGYGNGPNGCYNDQHLLHSNFPFH